MSAAAISHFPWWLVTIFATEKRVEGIQVVKEQLKLGRRNAGLVVLEMAGAIGYGAVGRQPLEDLVLRVEVATISEAIQERATLLIG